MRHSVRAMLLYIAFATCWTYKVTAQEDFRDLLPPTDETFPYGDRSWTSVTKSPFVGNDSIRPFDVSYLESGLQDLRRRLSNTRFGAEIEDVEFSWGFPSSQLKTWVDYWLNQYDWRAQERMLNQYPHFLTNVEGHDVHFVHIKPNTTASNIKVLPIVLLHGWPGSFFELYQLVPLLTTPQKLSKASSVAFEVVIPSLPGFGYSDAPKTPGISVCDFARMFAKLMTRLGHKKYYVYGGDWGSRVARCSALMYPERLLGLDLTLCTVPLPSNFTWPADVQKYQKTEFAFSEMLATKPESVNAALSDSPAGPAAFILDIFVFRTRPEFLNRTDGGLTEFLTRDELLTNVMIYWITNSVQTAGRIYKNNCGYQLCGKLANMIRYPVSVSTVLSDFPTESPGVNPPEWVVRPYFPGLIKFSTHPAGGHFSAMGKPNDLAEDIWTLASATFQRDFSN